MPYREIQFNVTDRVARITFARPPLNVLTISMMKEVSEAVYRVGAMNDVCAIVFSAAPGTRAFSAGVSIEEHRAESVFQMLEAFHSIFRALDAVSKPVVAIVTGAALGGGCELVAFADIVIAARNARFGQPEIKIGTFPPVAAVILPKVIGEKRARELILTGELLTADAACAFGLVNHVVGEQELEAKAEELLTSLRQLSAPALEMARRAMVQTVGLGFDEALKRAENIYLNQLMSYKDPQEGVEAFIEKRPPRWKHK
ncbi:MAG TPA: enoyl-CoA hydratase/isomerase family protein [Blastocatellia bacterium]|nr:enoyl-CoA hydratase/isomerase family protein [Blastocatellia bacterium]